MRAIQVKFIPATSFKEKRIKAWIKDTGCLTVPYDYNIDNNELQVFSVATKLLIKLNWNKTKISAIGLLPNDDYVATLEDK